MIVGNSIQARVKLKKRPIMTWPFFSFVPESSVPCFFFVFFAGKLLQLLETFDEHLQKFTGSQKLSVNHEEHLSAGDLFYF